MHSLVYRVNAVLTFGATVLAGLCLLASLADSPHFSFPDVHLEVLNVDALHRLNNGNDEAKLTLNILADLRSVFTWNTKQLFVFVVARQQGHHLKVVKLSQGARKAFFRTRRLGRKHLLLRVKIARADQSKQLYHCL